MSKEHHFFTPSEVGKSVETVKNSSLQENQQLEEDRLKSMYVKFTNPHDIVGEKGLVKVHQEQVELEKIKLRKENELYLRKHPEINDLMTVFLFKVLYDQPEDVVSYAGKYFDDEKLEDKTQTLKKTFLTENKAPYQRITSCMQSPYQS